MTARIPTVDAGAAPTSEEVAAIAAALQAAAPSPAIEPSPPGGRWRRAGRAYGDDALR